LHSPPFKYLNIRRISDSFPTLNKKYKIYCIAAYQARDKNNGGFSILLMTKGKKLTRGFLIKYEG